MLRPQVHHHFKVFEGARFGLQETGHGCESLANGVDGQPEDLQRYRTQEGFGAFIAKDDRHQVGLTVYAHPGAAHVALNDSAIGKLEGRALVRSDPKPAQQGGRQRGVGGPCIHQGIDRCEAPSLGVSNLQRYLERSHVLPCSPWHGCR